jgi:dynein heavy chain
MAKNIWVILETFITPLTDKCFITLMGKLKLNLGGAPVSLSLEERLKQVNVLKKALSKQIVVLNCSDSMDFIMIGKFFKRLASSGA